MLSEQEKDDGRKRHCLHPSEICKPDWCPRASYYTIKNETEKQEVHSFNLSNIFDEGHTIHDKWQNRFWKMGILYGKWQCLHCNNKFVAKSPYCCLIPTCNSKALKYLEVTVDAMAEYLIYGHCDGIIMDDIGDAMIEIKSIGIGTLRYEQPELLSKWGDDLQGLWNDIKRPFPSHLRQAHLYADILGVSEIVFIYECKWNQQVKEFVVKADPKVVASIYDGALDIKYALGGGRVPACIGDKCKVCTKDSTTDEKHGRSDEAGSGGSGSETAPEGAVPAQQTGVGDSDVAARWISGHAGRRPHGVVRAAHTLGGLLGGAGSPSGD